MKYTLTEVTEIPPDGRKARIPAQLYNDIIKVFIENQYHKARVEVPGVNPDGLARRLWSRVEDLNISVLGRGDGVYLRNNALVAREVERRVSGFKKAAPIFNQDFGLVYRYNNGHLVQRCDNCQGILHFTRRNSLWNCGKCGCITNNVY